MKKLNSVLSNSLIEKIEKEIILEIKDGYKQCLSFFNKPFDTFDSINIFDQKKEFFQSISEQFFSKFSSHPQVLSDSTAEARLKKYHVVFINFKGGSLLYPLMLTKFIDRHNFHENLSVSPVDHSSLTNFISTFPSNGGLFPFLEGLFRQIKQIMIPLRSRELKVLRILSDPKVLKTTENDIIRTTPPSPEDLVKILNLKENQLKTIQRARRFLNVNNICFFQNVIMNTSKYGFMYVLTASTIPKELQKFKVWSLPFHSSEQQILSLPRNNAVEYLQDIDYLPLTSWYWNVNMTNFSSKKKNSSSKWEEFEIIPFTDNSFVSANYLSWDLDKNSVVSLSSAEIEIIRNLSTIGIKGIESISSLSSSLSTNAIHKFLRKIGKEDAFQFYPNLNHIGLENIIGLYLEFTDRDLFTSIINNLLSYPIVHIYANDYQKTALGYVHLPKEHFFDFSGAITDFHNLYPKQIFLMHDFTRSSLITRSLNLSSIEFTYENGIAKEI